MTSPLPPVLSDLAHDRACQRSYGLPTRTLPPGTTSRRATLAAGLARYADGRPLLSIHVKSSVLSLSADPKISTRGFRNAGKSVQKTGK